MFHCAVLHYKPDMFVLIWSPGSWQREELRSDYDVPVVTAGNIQHIKALMRGQNLFI